MEIFITTTGVVIRDLYLPQVVQTFFLESLKEFIVQNNEGYLL